MSYTKRQFVAEAFADIGYANYAFDLKPEQIQGCLWAMDRMMARWYSEGIRLGYPLPVNPQDSDLDETTSVPDWANEAVVKNLVIRLAPGYGKAISPESKSDAKDAYDAIALKAASFVPQVQMPAYMPSGAGNRIGGYGRVFLDPPVSAVEQGLNELLS